MPFNVKFLLYLHTFVCLAFLLGCGASGPVVALVNGTVTLDGQPLEDGFIYFKTIETGNFERFEISKGEFKGFSQVGNRRIEIISNKTVTRVIDGAKVQVPENFIHSSCNFESKLTAKVTPEGLNKFDFLVKKK